MFFNYCKQSNEIMNPLAFIICLILSYSVSQAQDWASNTIQPEGFASQFGEDPNEGKIPISEQEIPEKVMEAFRTSVFQHMEIVQVFRLQDRALDQIIVDDTMAQPFYLFEFRLSYEGKSFSHYFAPNGDLYEQHRPV